jgi:hypothetical protein
VTLEVFGGQFPKFPQLSEVVMSEFLVIALILAILWVASVLKKRINKP